MAKSISRLCLYVQHIYCGVHGVLIAHAHLGAQAQSLAQECGQTQNRQINRGLLTVDEMHCVFYFQIETMKIIFISVDYNCLCVSMTE